MHDHLNAFLKPQSEGNSLQTFRLRLGDSPKGEDAPSRERPPAAENEARMGDGVNLSRRRGTVPEASAHETKNTKESNVQMDRI